MTKPIHFITAEEAVRAIKSHDHVHLSSVASAPQCLIKAMCERGRNRELQHVHIHHLHTEGPAPYAAPEFEGIFQLDSFFVGGNVRKVTQSGYADYIPVFLSETQKLYRSGVLPCNVAMIQVSPPDAHGYVSLGTSVDATLAAVECAQTVIAVINKHVPRSFGDAFIHVDDIDLFVQDDTPLEEAHFSEPNEVETAIGKHCAALIEDGACLQMGIGAIPNAVLAQLGGHKNLGIHTEMFADGVLPLVESGVINGRNKAIDKGKMVSTFLMGSQKVYDFIDNNPGVAMMDVGYTNDPFVIAKNPKVTAINSALQVDLTGQVCADSLGTKFYSGVGGQIDFIYGASRSEGGKAILAMPSTTNKGISKIAPELTLGAGVVTTRSHVHWFVTEYGAVNLYGRSLQERAADHQRRSPRPPRDARPRGFRALRRASPLHQGDDFRKKINTAPEQKTTCGPEGSGPHVVFFCRARPVATRTFSTRHSAVPANLSVRPFPDSLRAFAAARTVMPSQTFATAVPELRRATPRAVQTTPAGMLALGTDGKPPLSHDKRRALSERPSLASDQSFSGVRRPEAPLFIGGAGSADRGIASFATIVPVY